MSKDCTPIIPKKKNQGIKLRILPELTFDLRLTENVFKRLDHKYHRQLTAENSLLRTFRPSAGLYSKQNTNESQ